MKIIFKHIALISLFLTSPVFAQDVTTVRASNRDISDNLDLKAVASIFGESGDLEDFERRLNDPDLMISNLDLNGDNRVDYLRVIEASERNTHLIILQAVLGIDTFQDVATIEVERDRNNNVQVQVVGDVFMYGPNYIYEPVYVVRPVLFDVFWVSSYRPYYSPWYWGYYPAYYSYWAPCPVFRYRNHIHVNVINTRNVYTYVNVRRSSRAAALYSTRRANAYERQHPDRSFTRRTSAPNRYALEQSRSNSRSQAAGNSLQPGRRNTTDFNTSGTRSLRNNDGSSRSVNGFRSSGSTETRNTEMNVVRGNSNSLRNNGRLRSYDNNGTTPARINSAPSGEIQNSRQLSAPSSYSNNNNLTRSRSQSAPGNMSVPSRQSTPSRNFSMQQGNNTPPVRSTPTPPVRSSTSSPSLRATPTPEMRNSTPAPQRQSTPARQGGGELRGSRG
ncbi:hypothetical protein [Flavobacterium cyanobacteriorum]|uniref:hypothetical protein n=1 Tax=Flavobacterium cyanobacteriorum TaxID=2022802 RepID=UPI001A9C6472|nr:hypothetical protein [Flavobacterium cyanobacteriorum]